MALVHGPEAVLAAPDHTSGLVSLYLVLQAPLLRALLPAVPIPPQESPRMPPGNTSPGLVTAPGKLLPH